MEAAKRCMRCLDELCEKGGSIRLLLSVSGGKDSAALVHMIHNANRDGRYSLSLFHLNHKTRGEESDRDAAFVRDLATDYSLPLHMYEHDFDNCSNFEARAREVRYGHIHRIMQENSIEYAVTAHTLNDSVETSLMRLFRGTSLYGFRGIDRLSGRIIRPLLGVSTDEIEEYCRIHAVSYVHDSSNADMSIERNYMRNIVLPVIEERYPVYEAVSAMQNHSRTAWRMMLKYVLSMTSIRTGKRGREYLISERADDDEYMVLVSHIIREEMREMVTQPRLNEIIKKIHSRKSIVVLAENGRITISRIREGKGCLFLLSSNNPCRSVPVPELTLQDAAYGKQTVENDYYIIEYAVIHSEDMYCRDADRVFIEYDPEARYTVGSRKNGEIIDHNSINKRLKKIFIDCKLTEREKSLTAVIRKDGRCAAILFPRTAREPLVSDASAVSDKTKKILAIRYAQKYELDG